MSILLGEVLPLGLLASHLEDGVVRKQVHPEYPDQLYILNYTQKAAFDRIWDVCTNVCRGLIVERQAGGDVVLARGFDKFHNLGTESRPETMEANLPKEVPLVTKKLDGSMGILYHWDGAWWVATRGSFDSEQARWATRWVRQHESRGGISFWACFTPVFEILYRQNRIVVDYDFEGLVLLGIIDNRTGRELSRSMVENWAEEESFQAVPRFDKTLSECAAEDIPNEEGYVLTYSNGVKVKVKFAEYVRLHRILTGLNPKAIWELLAQGDGKAVYSILKDPKMPEGFMKWFSGWVGRLREEYRQIEERALTVFNRRPSGTRKTQALYFLKTPDLRAVLFALLDQKDHTSIIWKMVKPRGDETFKVEGE